MLEQTQQGLLCEVPTGSALHGDLDSLKAVTTLAKRAPASKP